MHERFCGPQNWYDSGYTECFYTGHLGFFYRVMHRLMEFRYDNKKDLHTILEVGAGKGQHLQFVRQTFTTYILSDIDSELKPAAEILSEQILWRQLDAENLIEVEDSSVDRLSATCLLMHLQNPMSALLEWRRVVRNRGHLVLYVAPEPGMLVRLIRNLVIFPKLRRAGVENPELLYYTQHKNHYPAIKSMIDEVFSADNISRKRYPLYLPWNFILFEILHIEVNK